MPFGKLLEFGLIFKAIDEATAPIKKITGALGSVKGAIAGFAGLEAFRFGTEQLEGFIESASKMQVATARLTATTGIAGEAIGKLREHAEALSEVNPATTSENWIAGYGQLFQNLHDSAAAMKAADVAAKAATATGAQYADVINLVNAAHENFKASATPVLQMLVATQRRFALSTEGMSGFTYAIARMAGAAQQSHTSLAQLFAIAGEASQLLPRGRGAQLMASLVSGLPSQAAKAGLDVSHGILGILQQIREQTRGLDTFDKLAAFKSLGIQGRVGAELIPLLQNLDKISQASEGISGDRGKALTSGFKAASATLQANVEMLAHAWSDLKDALGQTALPALTSAVEAFAALVGFMRKLTNEFPIVGKIVVGIGAIAALGGGLAAVGAAVSVIGSGFAVLSTVAGAVTAAVGAASGAFGGLGLAATAAWGAVTLPVAAAIAAIAAVGVATYEVYEHWAAIKSFFERFAAWFKGWGLEVLKLIVAPWAMLPMEIYKHFDAIKKAAGSVAHGIAHFFVGHSPIPEGPLHNLNLARDIAATIKPAPVINAVRRLAQTVAIAAPLAIAAPAAAAVGGSRASGPVVVHVHFALSATGAPGATLEEQLRNATPEVAHAVHSAVEKALADRARTEF